MRSQVIHPPTKDGTSSNGGFPAEAGLLATEKVQQPRALQTVLSEIRQLSVHYQRLRAVCVETLLDREASGNTPASQQYTDVASLHAAQ